MLMRARELARVELKLRVEKDVGARRSGRREIRPRIFLNCRMIEIINRDDIAGRGLNMGFNVRD